MTHRYEGGVKQAVIDAENRYIVSLANNKTLAVHFLHKNQSERRELLHTPPDLSIFNESVNTITIINENESKFWFLK